MRITYSISMIKSAIPCQKYSEVGCEFEDPTWEFTFNLSVNS